MKTISVVIPCYNYGHFIGDTIQSVLNQTMQDFEIIIVDDGSNLESRQVLKKWEDHPQIKIFYLENGGPSRARNYGIRNSNSKYILPLDADDKIERSYLEIASKVLDENSNIGIVYCDAEFFGSISGPWNLPDYQFPDIIYKNCIFVSSLFRREDWVQVNGFDETFSDEWEDFDFWLKIISIGRGVHKIPQTLFFYRKGHGSRTVRKHLELLPIYRKLIENHPNLYKENIPFLIESILKREARIEELEKENRKILASIEFKIGYYLFHFFPLVLNKIRSLFRKNEVFFSK